MLPLAMFGNPVEFAIIGGVIILLFGGSKFVGFGKSLGEGIKEFKKATRDEDEPSVAQDKKIEPSVIPASEEKK